jgi:peptide/nickel transport system permease protein
VTRWLLGRAAYAALLVWLVATLVFVLAEVATSPPTTEDAEGQEHLLACLLHTGADGPTLTRYVDLLRTGGLGAHSWRPPDCRPVVDLLRAHLPPTLLLGGLSLLVAWPIALGVGAWQALRSGSRADAVTTTAAVSLHAVPGFLVALGLQLLVRPLGLPLTTTLHRAPIELILPVVSLAVVMATGWIRPVRTAVVEALALPHVEAARARGLPEAHVLRRHVLPHALRPIVVLIGLSAPRFVAGSVIIEKIFAWPGMGRLLAESAANGDAPTLIMGAVLVAACVAAGDLLATAAAAALDPREVPA